jgi:putative oxidoreductase
MKLLQSAPFLVAARWWGYLVGLLVALQPLAQLAARIMITDVFWKSGLTKLRDWDITLALFHDEYHVPLLSPDVAAYLGTAGELLLPALLLPGLAGRFAALGLSVVNVMAALSLGSGIAEAALQQHVFWGSLLAMLALWGPGIWSLDHLLGRRYGAQLRAAAALPR